MSLRGQEDSQARNGSPAELRAALDLRTRDLSEALEQQAATAEVLRVISSSPGELEPVFKAMLENAVRLCEAKFGSVFRYEGGLFQWVAGTGTPPELVEYQKQLGRFSPLEGAGPLDTILREKAVVRIADDQQSSPPSPPAKFGGARSCVAVPMLKDNELVGAFVIYRQEVRPFTDKQIALVQNFAAQAVIAIENTRLFNELRQRTDDLSEALEQQTATSEVLQVISRSPGELEPVFQAMLENAIRICQAKFGTMFRYDGANFHLTAQFGTPAALAEFQRKRGPFRPEPDGPLDRILQTRKVTYSVDEAARPNPGMAARHGGARSLIAVPMLKENELIGAIHIFRQEVRPFTDKQIALLENFAAQAVIAIENTRLLNELRQRTGDLTESLEQQTATSEVLKVISGSPGELEPVFQATLANAVRICGATFGNLTLCEGDGFRVAALYNAPPLFADERRRNPMIYPEPGHDLYQLAKTKQVVQELDIAKVRGARALASLAGARTIVNVPMLKDDKLIGAIAIYRQEVRPFTDKQIELVQNFAAQAVIAIENTRLLNELRQRTADLSESLEQQTATSEVLKVISSSQGALEPVFRSILENATDICEAKFGWLFRIENGAVVPAASLHVPQPLSEFMRRGPHRPGEHAPMTRVFQTKQPVHVADFAAEQAYLERDPFVVAGVELGGARTLLAVPMLKDNELIGVIGIFRQEVRPFTDKQIELVTNFAAQAVIAIENARLLNELRQRTDDLTESLEQQTATSEVLKVISSSPGELDPVFQSVLQNAVHLCGAKFGALALRDGNAFRSVALYGVPPTFAEERRRDPLIPVTPGHNLDIAIRTKAIVHLPNLTPEHAGPPLFNLGGARALLNAPLLKDGEVVGSIAIYRTEPGPFSEKQIELVENFAAQAVIAIENTRLLNELRQRTDDLSEALEQQTATSEVLGVISASPGDLEPVFQAMLANATRICQAAFGSMLLGDGKPFRRVALHNAPPPFAAFSEKAPTINCEEAPSLRRVVDTKQAVHIADLAVEGPNEPIAKFADARTLVVVPMLKENELVGVMGLYRQEVRPFTGKQIALVENFAAQAVIAIENARLLNELRQRTTELEESYGTVRQQARQLEAQSQELRTLNQGLEQRVSDQVSEIERMGRLRRFLPPQVADLIVSSGAEKQLESHRREITALFCDLRGFTGFSESSDPEDVMALLREYHDCIGTIIYKHGGTLERFAGDGVMVIFNDPVPLPNPALAAVQMALEMRAAIGALVEKWRRLGHELGFGIGISHGYATLGTIGFEGRFDYAAIGTVSNVASRLCDEAEPGQILVSPRVLLAVEDAVTAEPVGEVTLKGLRRPLPVHNIVDCKAP